MRQFPTDAFWEESATPRGQLVGLALITVPAVVNPLPLGPALHAAVQFLAVVAGFVGALMVFGGLLNRVFLQPGDRTVDDVLPTVPEPYARRGWWALVGFTVLLVVGAEWQLVLIFTDSWSQHLPEVVMLTLPAVAFGWAAWRTRALRNGDAKVSLPG